MDRTFRIVMTIFVALSFSFVFFSFDEAFAREKGALLESGSFRVELDYVPSEDGNPKLARQTQVGDFHYNYFDTSGFGWTSTNLSLWLETERVREVVVEVSGRISCHDTDYAEGKSVAGKITSGKEMKGRPGPPRDLYVGSTQYRPRDNKVWLNISRSTEVCEAAVVWFQIEYRIFENADWLRKQAEKKRKEAADKAAADKAAADKAAADKAAADKAAADKAAAASAPGTTGDSEYSGGYEASGTTTPKPSTNSSTTGSGMSSNSSSGSSSSSSSSSSGGGSNAGTYAAAGGSAAAGVGGIAAAGAGGEDDDDSDSGSSSSSDDNVTPADRTAMKAISPWGAGHVVLVIATHVVIPASLMLVALIDPGKRSKRERDQISRSTAARVFFGPRGIDSWSGPSFSFSALTGISATRFRGLYFPTVPEGGKTTGAPGVLIDEQMIGAATHIALRTHFARFSVGYGHYLPSLLRNTFPEGEYDGRWLEISSMDEYTSYTDGESLLGLDLAAGVQFFQGLISPYAEYRLSYLFHTYGAGQIQVTNNVVQTEGGYAREWEIPLSHQIAIGNSFDFTGVFSDPESASRSAKLQLDASVTFPVTGVLQPTLNVGLGYSFSIL